MLGDIVSRYVGAPPGPRRMDAPVPAHRMYRAERRHYPLTATNVAGARVRTPSVAERVSNEQRLAIPLLVIPLLALFLTIAGQSLLLNRAPLVVASAPPIPAAETSPARAAGLTRETPPVPVAAGFLPAVTPVLPLAHPAAIDLVRLPAPRLTGLPEAAVVAPAAKPAVCSASRPADREMTHVPVPPDEPVAFGMALAAAARQQLGEFVIYNPRYQRISYPMGDVASLFGVCSDVVIRAYRALGIDLQELVISTRSGRDPHIDHRRVDTLRLFFTRHGHTLPVSDLGEDYRPGDIVTYYRPQNRTTTTHIAIVSDVLAASGRLMIIHNRGWGPQLEDALFVDRITGHFRFSGMPRKPQPTPVAAVKMPRTAILPPLTSGRVASRTSMPVASN